MMMVLKKVFDLFFCICLENVYFIISLFFFSYQIDLLMMSMRSLVMLSSDVVTKALSGPKRHI